MSIYKQVQFTFDNLTLSSINKNKLAYGRLLLTANLI